MSEPAAAASPAPPATTTGPATPALPWWVRVLDVAVTTSAVLAGMVWAIENPRAGIVEAEDMDFAELHLLQVVKVAGRAQHHEEGVPEALQLGAAVVDLRRVRCDVHVAAQHVDDLDLVTALLGGLDQAAGRVQAAVAREDGDLHRGFPVR